MGSVVDILLVIVALLAAFLISVWSCAKSYFEKGRVSGLKEAARQIACGAQQHFATAGSDVHSRIAAAASELNLIAYADANTAYEPLLWAFGEAIGDACWRSGHVTAVREGATPAGKIRVELARGELRQVSWLAHLGFQHMMPNYRGFEIHRFGGAEDAREGARSVAVLECALPARERPFADIRSQIDERDKLISNWWSTADRKSA